MKFNDSENKPFENCPAGTPISRCYGVIDLGTQTNTFEGETKETPQVVLLFETLDPDFKTSAGKPFRLVKYYTVSVNEKSNLYKDVVNWTGIAPNAKTFKINSLVGQYAMLNVIQKTKADGSVKSEIKGISSLHKSLPRPEGVNADIYFDMDAKGFLDDYAKVPVWLQKKIAVSPEWNHDSKASQTAPVKTPASNADFDPKDFEDDEPI